MNEFEKLGNPFVCEESNELIQLDTRDVKDCHGSSKNCKANWNIKAAGFSEVKTVRKREIYNGTYQEE